MKNEKLTMKKHLDIRGMLAFASSSAAAYQYINRDSIIHRSSPFLKVVIWLAFMASALLLHDPLHLSILILFCSFYYLLTKPTVDEFISDTKLILMVSFFIVLSYSIIFRDVPGIIQGIAISFKIFLLFVPMIVLLKTTSISSMLYSFRKILPYRYVFAITLALRFLPYFSREMINIIDVQRMRGVNITWKTFLSIECINSILIPLVMRAIKTADELSMSVSSRGFGAHKKRTYLEDFEKTRDETRTA